MAAILEEPQETNVEQGVYGGRVGGRQSQEMRTGT